MRSKKDKAFKARQANVDAAKNYAFKVFKELEAFYESDLYGITLEDMAGALNSLGIKTRFESNWHRNTVRRIFDNYYNNFKGKSKSLKRFF